MSEELAESASVGSSATSTEGGSSPATPVESASAPAGESIQPGPTEPGPVPYGRFKEVNDKYGGVRWAEGLSPQAVQQQQAFFTWLDRDPVGAFRYLEDYLTRAGTLRAAKNPEDGRPSPSIRIAETGQQFYTAEDADRLVAWAQAQQDARLNERLQPIESTIAAQRAHSIAAGQIAEAETWPHYKAHEGAILQAMEADHRLSLEGAYRRVVLPQLRQLERQAVLAEMKQKPTATTHNPGAPGASQTRPLSKLSWADVFRHEFAKRR